MSDSLPDFMWKTVEETMDSNAEKVRQWNMTYPVGTPVSIVKKGERIETKTSTQAEVLSGHTPVVWLDGVSGCYALNHVTVLK